MVSQKTTIKNLTGLHITPAGLLCETATQFKSKISFRYKDATGNAKSMLSILGAGIKRGDQIELICEGDDEAEALTAMLKVIEDGLGE